MPHMFEFGATAWSLGLPDDSEGFRIVAEQIKNLPFYSEGSDKHPTIVEVFASMDAKGHDKRLETAREIKEIAKGLGMKVFCCGFNPYNRGEGKGAQASPHLTDPNIIIRDRAVGRVLRAIEYAAEVAEPNQGVLTGPWHMRHMYLRPQEDGEIGLLKRMIENRILPYAERAGVKLALEPLRPSEGYIPGPGKQALKLVTDIGSDYLGLNVDTVHLAHARGDFFMNLSEAVESGKLFHLHLSELNREEWGTGMLGGYTEVIFDTLIGSEYQGGITLENFCNPLKPLIGIWAPDPDKRSALEVLEGGAEYVRDNSGL